MTPGELLGDFRPDIIFMDPARRSADGSKVFLLEHCSPDVLSLRDELFSLSRYIMLKVSPMADIKVENARKYSYLWTGNSTVRAP